jgi:hypothetical protein
MDPSCTWPGSQPDDLRRTSGRHRCSRACEVHARYIAGGDVSHCDSSNQVTPNSSSKTAASPHGCPGLTNPADERSGQPRPLCPPAKCHGLPDRYPSHQRTAFPPARAPGKHRGRRADTGGARPTRRRVKPEQAACAARPWPSVETRRVHRPSRRPARRPLCVRGCRNTAPNSATR